MQQSEIARERQQQERDKLVRERQKRDRSNDKWITLPNGRRVLIAKFNEDVPDYLDKKILKRGDSLNHYDWVVKHDNRPDKRLANWRGFDMNVIPENIGIIDHNPRTNHQNKMIEKVSQVQNETWKPNKKQFKDKVGLLKWRSNLEESKAIDNDRGARD